MTALLGLGTYRIPVGEMAAAARRAALSPSAWIDTAPNYAGGRAHRLLAPALAEHPGTAVATKAGFLAPVTAGEAHAAGVLDDPGARHSLDPTYVRWQMDRSRTELGRTRLDALFLHNPEHGQQPGHGGELANRLRAAFTVLEAEAAAGHLTSYGVATWNGFADGLFTVPQLDRLATEAAGGPEHHLCVVQLPVSLVMADHLGESLHGYGPIHQAADRGWEVHASAPLHGGELLTLATPEVAALVKKGATVAAACLAAAASCPGVTRVLLSASTPAHWTDALTVTAAPAIPPDTLRTALDVLATPG